MKRQANATQTQQTFSGPVFAIPANIAERAKKDPKFAFGLLLDCITIDIENTMQAAAVLGLVEDREAIVREVLGSGINLAKGNFKPIDDMMNDAVKVCGELKGDEDQSTIDLPTLSDEEIYERNASFKCGKVTNDEFINLVIALDPVTQSAVLVTLWSDILTGEGGEL